MAQAEDGASAHAAPLRVFREYIARSAPHAAAAGGAVAY